MNSEATILYEVIAILGLLGISSLVYIICKRIAVPFAVGLLLSGISIPLADKIVTQVGLLFGSNFLLSTGQRLAEFNIGNFIEFSPSVVFFIFLPTLIFESAYHLNYRTFRGVIPEVIALSTLGLTISIIGIGSILHYLVGLPWSVSLLFGSLISATDPVAILAIFKEMRIPKRLSTIVDGESLMNDGTALIIFQILLAGILGSQFNDKISASYVAEQGGHLLFTIMAAILIGAFFGWLFSFVIAHTKNKGVQLTLSIILAHVTFIVSEVGFHASGILATMIAGIIVGNFGRRKMHPDAQHSFADIWQFVGFVSNSLVFLLLGVKLGQTNLNFWNYTLIAGIGLILIIRPLSVIISLSLTNKFRNADIQQNWKEKLIISWGGLRGALAAAAVLLIPETFIYAEQLQAMTAGVIFMTFMINAMTMKPLLKWLNFGEYTVSEKIQYHEAQALINEKVIRHLDHIKKIKYINTENHHQLVHEYREKVQKAEDSLSELKDTYKENKRETEKILTHYSLGIELRTYKKLFHYKEISEDRLASLVSSINRQLGRLERDELPDERKSPPKIAPPIPKKYIWEAEKIPFIGPWVDYLYQAYRRKKVVSRWQHYRARSISSAKVVRDFQILYKEHDVFKHSPIVKKIMQRYKKWNVNAEKKIQKLEADFPEILRKTRFNFVQNMCFLQEKQIEKEFLDKGFISDKIFEDLQEDIRSRSKKCRSSVFSL